MVLPNVIRSDHYKQEDSSSAGNRSAYFPTNLSLICVRRAVPLYRTVLIFQHVGISAFPSLRNSTIADMVAGLLHGCSQDDYFTNTTTTTTETRDLLQRASVA